MLHEEVSTTIDHDGEAALDEPECIDYLLAKTRLANRTAAIAVNHAVEAYPRHLGDEVIKREVSDLDGHGGIVRVERGGELVDGYAYIVLPLASLAEVEDLLDIDEFDIEEAFGYFKQAALENGGADNPCLYDIAQDIGDDIVSGARRLYTEAHPELLD